MLKRTIYINLIFAFFIQISMGYSQNSNLIYKQVLEMQDEFSKEVDKVFVENMSHPIPADANEYVSKAEFFEIKESFVQETKKNRPNTLCLEIPFEGKILQAQLYKKDVTTSNYKVKSASGAKTEFTKSIFYRGILKGKSNSIVSLSLTNSGLRMTVVDEKGSFEINKIDKHLYAAYRVSESKHNQDTGCSTDHDFVLKHTKIKKNTNSSTRAGDCVEVYIECDFDSYNTNGASIQNTEDWALSIMNEVGIFYENAGVPLVVSDILVYDEPDPYLAGGDSGGVLGLMGSVIGNDYNGRLAHVFSTRSLGGGIAFVDVLCDVNSGGTFGPYGVSGSMNPGSVPFPVFSWNVMVVAHELGHNVGSLHTHDCVWNGNNTQIDDCGNVETDDGDFAPCFDENNPILPSGGTIMSYCHLAGGIGIDFNLGFHSQVGALLFNRYSSAPCITGENCAGGGNGPVADFTFTQFNPCNPSEVQFTDLSQNEPSSYLWEFPGGTPSSSTDQNPFVTYSQPGFYDVTLTVSNFSGNDVLTLNQIIEVLETPVPDFDYEIENSTMKFSNQTTGAVSTYFWDFGDSGSSTEENPCHAYEEDGSYLVILTVNGFCGNFVVEEYVDFFTPPTAAFEADTTLGCSPFVVNFMNNSSENTIDYHWTFEGGDPETSTDENPSVEYDSTGVYDVTLIVSNDIGDDTLTMVQWITVKESPIADFTFNIDSLEVMFTSTPESYDTLMWDFGDGNTSTMTSPTHTYEEEGSYDVSLVVSNICDTITVVQTVELSSLPMANYSANVTDGCLPLTVEFSNESSSNADTWEWSFPGGTPANSTEENPTVIYNQAGVFDVTLVVNNESGPDSLIELNFISVEDVPTADFDFAVDYLEVEFEELSIGYESILWNFGDGNTSTESEPIHSYEEDGSYEVVFSATNSCGVNTKIKTVVVSSLPTAGFSSDIQEECLPFVVAFTNNSSSNVDELEWSFPGGDPSSSTEENPIISYETAGTYNVSLIVTSSAGKDTLLLEDFIVSNAMPTADFEYAALSEFEYSFTNLSTDGESFYWDFGDETDSTEENPTHTYDEYGTYTVVLSVTNECGEEIYEDEVVVSDITSTHEIETLKDLNVYPNPNTGEFVLSVNSVESGEVILEIYNTLGQTVLSDRFKLVSGSNKKSIHLQNPVSGVYLALLKNGNQTKISKVFVD